MLIDIISFLGFASLLLLTILLPTDEEKPYVYTNLIFIFPSLQAVFFKYYDISFLSFSMFIASSGWHYYKTTGWRRFDATTTLFLILYISLRLLPFHKRV